MPNGTTDNCPACGDHRRAHTAWMTTATLEQKRAEQERAQAEAAQREQAAIGRAMAIAECELCDDEGYTADRRVCNHNPDQDATNAAGMAKVRAALAKDGDL